MGEVVGLAASICIEQKTTPRGVWKEYLDQLKGKMIRPVYSRFPEPPLPKELESKVGRNIVRDAKVTASSQALASYSPVFVNDGRGSEGGNGMRWVSMKEDIPWLEFELKEPVSVTAMLVTSGFMLGGLHSADKDYRIAGELTAPIEDYRLEVWYKGKWNPIAGTSVTGNTRTQRSTLFIPTEGKKFRLLVTKTPGQQAQVWEIELFTIFHARRDN
jgi:hypothetical protein